MDLKIKYYEFGVWITLRFFMQISTSRHENKTAKILCDLRLTSRILSPDCRRPSLTAAPLGKMFLTRMGPGPCTEESLVTTVKPNPSGPTDIGMKGLKVLHKIWQMAKTLIRIHFIVVKLGCVMGVQTPKSKEHGYTVMPFTSSICTSDIMQEPNFLFTH